MKRMYDENEIKSIASEAGGTVNKLDLVVGEPTVTYDAVNGIAIESTGKLNDEKDITVSNEIPILPGKGIVIDKPVDKEAVEVKVDINEATKVDTYLNSIVIGDGKNIKASYSIDIGYSEKYNTSNAFNTVTIGRDNLNEGSESVVIGDNNFVYSYGGSNGKVAIGHRLSNTQDRCVILGTYGSTSDGDRFVLADGDSSSNTHKYFVILYKSDGYHMYLNQEEVPTKFKTIFGNQSLSGTGNIDLYKHSIKGTSGASTFYLRLYSSNNLQVSSLTDLKTLLGATFEESATGSNGIIAITNDKVLFADGTDASISGYTITDTVTTI